jgi:protein-S-isoprenylcysteine O-methyltransferase Ste14
VGPVLWEWPGWWRLLPWFVQACGLGLIAWGSLVVGSTMLLGLPHLRAIESGQQEPQAEFTALPPYAYMRQPINAGFLLVVCGLPVASLDLLLMALVFGAWILLAAPFEERDLEIEFDGYAAYRERTPRWIPRLRGRDR